MRPSGALFIVALPLNEFDFEDFDFYHLTLTLTLKRQPAKQCETFLYTR
jgi:hypothetical protein